MKPTLSIALLLIATTPAFAADPEGCDKVQMADGQENRAPYRTLLAEAGGRRGNACGAGRRHDDAQSYRRGSAQSAGAPAEAGQLAGSFAPGCRLQDSTS